MGTFLAGAAWEWKRHVSEDGQTSSLLAEAHRPQTADHRPPTTDHRTQVHLEGRALLGCLAGGTAHVRSAAVEPGCRLARCPVKRIR
jgi:hypothetical protein